MCCQTEVTDIESYCFGASLKPCPKYHTVMTYLIALRLNFWVYKAAGAQNEITEELSSFYGQHLLLLLRISEWHTQSYTRRVTQTKTTEILLWHVSELNKINSIPGK